MTPLSIGQVRAGYYALTAANTLATSYYLNYLFFYLRDHFGFGNRDNLWVSAIYGLLCTVAAWPCGKFAERHGYNTSVSIGFGGLSMCMAASAAFGVEGAGSALGLITVLSVYSVVLQFTWPALEAVTTAHVPPSRVPHLVGIYNCTWSGAAAFSYFTGGALYESFGSVAVFWIPAVLFFGQFVVARWLRGEEARAVAVLAPQSIDRTADGHPEAAALNQPVPPVTFLRLAWIASPLSYVAIYAVLPVMPGLAQRLGLTPTETGVFCSVWMFARMAAFIGLWGWTGWHYRFRWLLLANLVLVASFAAILLAPSLEILVVAQVAFGLAIGLIYYSSLFYSMDAGHARAEHGGIHEAVIGLGSFVGPAVGAGALMVWPGQAAAGTVAVSAVLMCGVAAVVTIWARARSGRAPGSKPGG